MHCISCGKPLDFNKSPETKRVLDEHCFAKEDWPMVLKKTIFALFFTVIILIPAGYLCPKIMNPDLAQVDGNEALKRFKALTVRIGRQEQFTCKELAFILKNEMNATFSKTPENLKSIVAKNISIDVTGKNSLAVTISYRALKGNLPLFCTYYLTFSAGENESCKIERTATKLGLFPLPEKFTSHFKDEMINGLNLNWSLSSLIPRLRKVTVKDRIVTIDVI